MKKRLAILLVLSLVVGCGKNEQKTSPVSVQSNANLTACPDCKGKVSKLAAACPHCGRPLSAHQVGDGGKSAEQNTSSAGIQKALQVATTLDAELDLAVDLHGTIDEDVMKSFPSKIASLRSAIALAKKDGQSSQIQRLETAAAFYEDSLRLWQTIESKSMRSGWFGTKGGHASFYVDSSDNPVMGSLAEANTYRDTQTIITILKKNRVPLDSNPQSPVLQTGQRLTTLFKEPADSQKLRDKGATERWIISNGTIQYLWSAAGKQIDQVTVR